MSPFKDATTEHQLKRWMRPDAHRFVRSDWRRYVRPDSELSAVFELYERKYSPEQPRVPAGSRDGGQWTSDGATGGEEKPNRVREATSDKPRLGRSAMAAIAMELAKRAIEAFRKENGLYDLFKSKIGTVSQTTLNGNDIFGSNSTSPMYYTSDRVAADGLRDILKDKQPDVFKSDNMGDMPNNALYHAETTVLLRAARENGGTLAGETLEVHTDRPMCGDCKQVLPYVGLELGNPTITYVGPNGDRKTMRDGRWIFEGQP